MKLNQKLIEQLRNDEIAAENNGTLEQLREVFKAAFPKDVIPTGNFKYYSRSAVNKDGWMGHSSLDEGKPTFKISDFYQPDLFTGWAKDDEHPKWMLYFKDDIGQFGVNADGWMVNAKTTYSFYEANRPATHEEIESTLIKEAKRRGYKKGVICIFGKKKLKRDIDSDVFEYLPNWDSDGGILSLGGDIIFTESTGKWAEIVEQPEQIKTKTNPIHYTVDGTTYSLNYQELKAEYNKVTAYTHQEFMANLPQIAHLACIVSYFKGLGVQATISDKGIIHELIHLMTSPDEPTNDLQDIREKFNRLIKLV